MSQSVMSQQMKPLEEELGVILFERKNRGFHLTRAEKFFIKKVNGC
ncbi:LysR family transcriptional regulator [Streptococcus anginosus]|nr:LysR family transcriptional regulator [Streptococcus anginosus]